MNKFTPPSDTDNKLIAVTYEEQKADNTINSLSNAEEEPDNVLVEEARTKLQGIFISYYQEALGNALLEAGMYIIETFYDNNYESARKNKPQKALSYAELEKHLKDQNENSPKKSWLYNAVNLAIQEADFPDFHALGKLNTTHKLLLLTVYDPDTKQKLAEETEEKEYSSRELAKRIKESKKQRSKTIFSYLSTPEDLFADESKHLYSSDTLKKMTPKKLETLRDKVRKQVEKTRSNIAKQEQLAKQYERLFKTVDKVAQEKNSLSTSDV